MYSDARLSSIYEGTTQLQAVAAIPGVTTGVFLEQIRAYQEEVEDTEGAMSKVLEKMTDEYVAITETISTIDVKDYLDFHSRRLVEMAGNIIMGYLLLINSQRDEKFVRSAKLFINLVRSENHEKYHYINDFEFENLDLYKMEIPEMDVK